MNTPTVQRTPRVWTEPCDRCSGSGIVQRREHFSLWTPDEFGHGRPLDPKYDVPSDAYVCTAVPGSSINEACSEAVSLAALVRRPVAFAFNGTVVVIREGDDPRRAQMKWFDEFSKGK